MIGIFDSGAGGLTIAKEIRALLPQYDLLYFGDTARYPYGTQSPTMLKRYATEDAALLLELGAKIIVIACNSAASAASDDLRQSLKEPVFDVIGPATEEAKKVTKTGRIGVIGTKATITSGVYQKSLAGDRRVITAHATPMLVPLVEERWWKHPESMRIVRRSLKSIKDAHVDTLVMACTHYPLIENLICRSLGKNVRLVNPARATALALQKFLLEHPDIARSLNQTGAVKYYVSSDPKHFEETARWWMGEKVKVEEIKTKSENFN